MAQAPLLRRVQNLEETVEHLSELPTRMTRVESQIVQFCIDVQGEFVALRREMAEGSEALRAEMHEGSKALRAEMREGDEALRREMHTLHGQVIDRIDRLGVDLRAEIGESWRHARVLFEEALARIAVLQEGHAHPRSSCRSRKR